MRSRFLRVMILMVAVIGQGCSSPTEPRKVTSLALSATRVQLDAIGATATVRVVARDQNGDSLPGVTPVWTSNAPAVATVSSAGLITGISNGTAQLSVTVESITSMVLVEVSQVPVAPVVVAGNGQTGKVAALLPDSLRIRLEDRLGRPIVGAIVDFAVVAGGGSVSTGSVITGTSGIAGVRWTLGRTAGASQTVAASVAGGSATTLFTATSVPDDPTLLRVAPGNLAEGQQVRVGSVVPILPAVQVLDAYGNGVPGRAVTFVVTAGGGRATGESAVTGIDGIATLGSWTVGATVGDNRIEARMVGFAPVVFVISAIPDPCTFAGAPSITVGATVAASLVDADCPWTPPASAESSNDRYDLYRFTLSERRGVVIEMLSQNPSQLDPFLYLYDATSQALLASNDDVQLGVIQNSRIARVLDAGSYVIRATGLELGNRGPYTITLADCVAGQPAQVRLLRGNGQTAPPGGMVAVSPAVVVTDNCDIPVPNASVTFTPVPGSGSVTGGTTITDPSGVASLAGWTLAEGPNVLAATVAGLAETRATGNPVVFSASGASAAGFDIALRFVVVPTVSQLDAFRSAATQWESIITGDLPAQAVNLTQSEAASFCDSPEALNETVDDVLIIVNLDSIDGPGQILGQAGPCTIRSSTNGALTAVGTMSFDRLDLASLASGGRFNTVILHEMGHVLGIGTLWVRKNLLVNPSTTTNKVDTYFSGSSAIAAFDAIGGSAYTLGQKVPVENCVSTPAPCGGGTINSHWRDAVLVNELMTGYLNSGEGVTNPLSLLTVASLRDIGYTVNDARAEAFEIRPALTAGAGLRSMDRLLDLGDDVNPRPIQVLDPSGRLRGQPVRPTAKKTRGR